MRRVGLFGGTFDPPHLGHLALAEWAREALALDRVVFMPAGSPPHKTRRTLSPVRQRLAMIRLAVRGTPAFVVSAHEARRGGPSYTVDTLRHLKRAYPGARLYLLMGADSLAEFETWREPGEIARLATLAVADRPGSRRSHARPAGIPASRVVWLHNPALALSSSALRKRARQGISLRYLVPEAVAGYIARHRVYRGSAMSTGIASRRPAPAPARGRRP
jgi:nicotinate-nucleotide adenylyltransferase